VIGVVLATLARTAAAAGYEAPRTFQASEILKPDEIQGQYFTVAPEVRTEAFFHVFRLDTNFGPLEAEGRSVLAARQRETRALAELDRVSKARVFLEAAGMSVVGVGKGVASVAADPEGTAKGLGAGLERFGTNLGRKAKRAGDKAVDAVSGDDEEGSEAAEGPERSTGEKAASAASGIANSVFGVNGAARRWAKKVGVDPYTTNPLLRKTLIDIGRVDRAGSLAMKIALPVPVLVGQTAKVGQLVWDKDPEELQKLNEAKLREVGAGNDVIKELYLSSGFTLTLQTRLAEALHRVRAKGSADYAAAAAESDTEREALFFVESAEMLERLHRERRVSAVLHDSRAMVASTADGRAVLLLPVDWIRWTRSFDQQTADLQARAAAELGAKRLELRTTGRLTDIARRELKARGIEAAEGLPFSYEAKQR
jgi:hypothetical protein